MAAPPMVQVIQLPAPAGADGFAKAYLDTVQARSFATNLEHCGLFGQDARGAMVATPAIRGQTYSCLPPVGPAGFRPFASYHTHGGYDPEADSEVPSSYDVIADLEERLVGYISTPGGRVWRSENGVARLLCGQGCISVDPAYRAGTYAPVATTYTIEQLRLRERELVYTQ